MHKRTDLSTRAPDKPVLRLDDTRAQQTVLEALRSGLGFAAAAGLLGVTRQTLLTYRKRNPDFDDACVRATAEHEYSLVRIANEGAADDARLALELLSRRYPSKWSQRIEMRRDLDDDSDREMDDAAELSDAELLALAQGGGK